MDENKIKEISQVENNVVVSLGNWSFFIFLACILVVIITIVFSVSDGDDIPFFAIGICFVAFLCMSKMLDIMSEHLKIMHDIRRKLYEKDFK